MRFNLNFIKEFLDINISAEKLAELLTLSGIEVENLQKTSDEDWIFEIEVTSNRYDWLSIIGIAREISATLGKKLNIKYPSVKKTPNIKSKKIFIEDLKDCPLYIARLLTDLKVEDSPDWLKNLLLKCGLNSVNNIVDITNYCMLKWGNPLHAFDLDKIEGNIFVRRAKENEPFVGIDGKERLLNSANLVIADEKKVIALAGVMGAKNSEVDSSTKNVLLEAAIFSPVTIRISRRSVGLDTEASYRFERRVFDGYLEFASSEAAILMQQIARAKFWGYLKVGSIKSKRSKKIFITKDALNSYLGTAVKEKIVKDVLENLGFKVNFVSRKIEIGVPDFRLDIERAVDIYEEFARIYGYDKIPSKLPAFSFRNPEDDMYEFKNRLVQFLMSVGFNQIITYSIESEKELNLVDQQNFIKLLNPLREQENVLRPSLLLGMLKTVKYNMNRNWQELYLYEIADVYFKDADKIIEKPMLAIATSGEQKNLFLLKGTVEKLLEYLSIENFTLKEESFLNFKNALSIKVEDCSVGFLGKLNKSILEKFDLSADLFFAELDLKLLKKFSGKKRYKQFSPYPYLARDISLALRNDIKFRLIREIIEKNAKFVSTIRVIDIYKGKEIPEKFHAFTLRIYYQSKEKTLTSEEVDNYHNQIREILSKTDGVILR